MSGNLFNDPRIYSLDTDIDLFKWGLKFVGVFVNKQRGDFYTNLYQIWHGGQNVSRNNVWTKKTLGPEHPLVLLQGNICKIPCFFSHQRDLWASLPSPEDCKIQDGSHLSARLFTLYIW